MIATIRGMLLRKKGKVAVIDVAGLGFEVQVPDSTGTVLPPVGEPVELETHVEVQEDGIRLYGFATVAEKEAFRLMNSVSKVGPRVCLEVLSIMTVDQFRETVASGDLARLQTVPGIGRKLAERIRFELKDKVGSLPAAEPTGPVSKAPRDEKVEGAVRGLVYLGLRDIEARRAVEQVLALCQEEPTVQDLIREALRSHRE